MLFRSASPLSNTLACGLALLLTACGGSDSGSGGAAATAQGTAAKSAASMSGAAAEASASKYAGDYELAMPMVKYRWDPQAGDASVSAELGGPGFTGEGWQTNLEFPAIGSAQAVKGGTFKMHIPDWPATLRLAGKDYNTAFNYRVNDICFQGLLQIHPSTLEFIPSLATHWWIAPDKSTYRFRINPTARWSNGKEITADDVIATWKLLMDEGIQFPSSQLTFGKFEEPTKLSKYIVEVKVKEESWRNFMYFGASMMIFPAEEISIPGAEYLDKFQFKHTAMSGPYMAVPEDMVEGQRLGLRRNTNWWDAGNPAWTGLWNFDRYEFEVVKDQNLAFEKLKKGEIEYMDINVSKWWVDDMLKSDPVQRGLIVRRKFFTDAPIGTSGTAINTTRAPLDDLRIRKALCHLENRELYIEKLFYNEYERLSSYYQGGTYQNPDNVAIDYDELTAVELLEEAGWTELDSDGFRIKDGKRLEFDLIYRSTQGEKYLTTFQGNCKRAGIKIDLQLLTPAAHWKNIQGKDYELASTAWGALVFPNPETSWKSELGRVPNNNNITGFQSDQVDALLAAYDAEYDVNRRVELIREIDGILFNEHNYILGWYNPSQRIAFWNKFGMPEWGTARTFDQDSLMYVWWVDPKLEAEMLKAKASGQGTMDTGRAENHFWQAWQEVHGSQSSVSAQ